MANSTTNDFDNFSVEGSGMISWNPGNDRNNTSNSITTNANGTHGGDEESFQMTRQNSILDKYLELQAKICLDNYKPSNSSEGIFCPRTFDGWTCWNETKANETAYAACPIFVTGFDPNKMWLMNWAKDKRGEFPVFPIEIFEKIIKLLKCEELKNCRLVCRDWDYFAAPLLQQQSTIVFNWEKKRGFFYPNHVEKLIQTVKSVDLSCPFTINYNSPFSKWTQLRIKNGDSNQLQLVICSLEPLLFQSAVYHLTEVELCNCTFRLTLLIDLLGIFPHIKQFSESQCTYTLDKILLCCGLSLTSRDETQSLRKIAGRRLNTINKLKICQKDTDQNTNRLLKALHITVSRLEELDFQLENHFDTSTFYQGERIEFSAIFGVFLQRNMSTLTKMRLDWRNKEYTQQLYNEFFLSAQIFSWPESRQILLTEISLIFDWIFAGDPNFTVFFLPFIRRCVHLKKFVMEKMLFEPELIISLDGLCPDGCTCQYGFCLTDDSHILRDLPSSEIPHHLQESLKSEFLTKSLCSLRIAVENVWELKELIPMGDLQNQIELGNNNNLDESQIQNEKLMVYEGADEFFISRFRDTSPFFSFNIDHLVQSFPNITILTILDGPVFDYSAYGRYRRPKKQYDQMSNAQIANEDMQSILSNLVKLKNLKIRACMKNVSDFGLCGSSKYQNEQIGASFSNLRDFGHKECMENGEWFVNPDSNQTWSNYTTCVDYADLHMRTIVITISEIGYLISITALIISLIIFCSFKSLACTRVKIHKHLFASFIISNVLWLTWYRVVIVEPDILYENPLWCIILHILVEYFMIANYFNMFTEGFYLHTLLVVAFFRSEKALLRGFFVFAWIGPALPISAYIYFRRADSMQNTSCWVADSTWRIILGVPVCLSLILSLGFLINILRVLVKKIKESERTFSNICPRNLIPADGNASESIPSSHNESHRSLKKAVRATLLLIPLLGLYYFIIPFRPTQGSAAEVVYEIISALASSLQGFCVSLLFCFCNSEVQTIFRRRFRRTFKTYVTSPSHNRAEYSCAPTCRNDKAIERNGNTDNRNGEHNGNGRSDINCDSFKLELRASPTTPLDITPL